MNYDRNRPLIDEEKQGILGERTVALIGLGGLGGYLAQGALRLGIRSFILIDGDIFEKTNLNRQLFSSPSNLGRAKVEVAKEELLKIDPSAKITIHKKWIKSPEDSHLLEGADLILDGLDSAESRRLLMEIGEKMNLPLVHGALAGLEGQFALLDRTEYLDRIYGSGEVAEEANLSFLPSLVASFQLKLMMDYFIFPEKLEKNVLFRISLEDMEIIKIPL